MLNLHPLEYTIKDDDYIPDLLLIKYLEIISCKVSIATQSAADTRPGFHP